MEKVKWWKEQREERLRGNKITERQESTVWGRSDKWQSQDI
jgi:hypothetical protein